MFLVPYNTDASIYHWPYATGAMIATNVAAFIGVMCLQSTLSEEQFYYTLDQLMLLYGQGIRPWQWITRNFMHADIFHLLGNMFGLWCFGLIVEGKVGWWRFLVIYFGMGISQCAFEQVIMLFAADGASLGASGIIYGLMAICLIWVPQNDVHCLFATIFFFRPIWFTFEMPISMAAGLMIFLQITTSLFSGLAMSSQFLHSLGAVIGLGVGITMLRRGWVDCERWDLFSVLRGENKEPSDEREELEQQAKELVDQTYRKRIAANEQASEATSRATGTPASSSTAAGAELKDNALSHIRHALSTGDPAKAYAMHLKLAQRVADWKLPERELLQIITGLQKRKMWSQSVDPMVTYLANYVSREPQVRLKLAHVLMEAEQRPAQALKVLDKLNPALVSEKEAAQLERLRARGEQLQTRFPREVADQDW